MLLAEIEKNTNIVLRVIRIEEDEAPTWASESERSYWVETSDSGEIRNCFAIVGGEYLPDLDIFMPIRPYASWVVDESDYSWVSPVPHPDPDSEIQHFWDESAQAWVSSK